MRFGAAKAAETVLSAMAAARVEMMSLFMVVLLMKFEASLFDSLRLQITVHR